MTERKRPRGGSEGDAPPGTGSTPPARDRKAGADLPPAAVRALREAEERRAAAARSARDRQPERNGRGGLDPVRYGDWEIKGLTSDF